jgi:hypothetical protein
MGQPMRFRSLRKGAIDDLIDGVNGFPFTGTATQDEHTGDQLKLRVIAGVMAVILIVLSQNDFGNANGLTAVTT